MHYVTHKYWSRGDLKYHKFERPKPIELFELCYGEIYKEKLPPLIIHNRVLKILQEMCPNDFQRFDMVIKNFDPSATPFENKEFHIINVTHRIKALDLDKSVYEIDEDQMF